MTLADLHPLPTVAVLLFSSGAAAILLWFLLARPALHTPAKVVLLFGFGILPIATAVTTNVAGFHHTACREFCGSCHVMTPYTDASSDPLNTSLAARHGRNERFGEHNCYECHRDYGAFSTLLTKWGGMRHVWEYYTEYYRYTLEESRARIALRKPYSNAACTRCHAAPSQELGSPTGHGGMVERRHAGEESCVSTACHGPAHGTVTGSWSPTAPANL